ncbi:N-acetylglutamate synthase-like GNAT family acetyltransferase [Branchiibius hedensis]|uniref:N-acetylglutamate synthase, GNAT family n=1 Tax=Branchiibius hedensis TaxID=672460 RepID=A0A2Y9BTK6_9MICO|nr:GNAT family N-acetyltransferase [Branchiibius hedensis]PWJ25348.1 N-acetylglutamate synthase-like GNAT family acetyltransferase [Branchiibius hedensis]SSA34162.1 N-acetylglutamate synthase, GNAT family [Branchiibius hedensis]
MCAISYRRAHRDDIPAIVHLLADDPLGATRESPDDLSAYFDAFAAVAADPHQHLMVAVRDETIVGTLQLTLIPGLSRRGATRAQIESVRVAGGERGSGLGTALLEWAIEEARRLGADLVQLTSDAGRVEAHRFYEQLGFTPTHLGFKLEL